MYAKSLSCTHRQTDRQTDRKSDYIISANVHYIHLGRDN